MSDPTNPFAALSLIVAPAVLTKESVTPLRFKEMDSAPVVVVPATLEVIAVAAGFIGVMGLVLGCVLLLRETRIAVRVVSDEATHLRNNLAQRAKSS